MKKNGKSSGKWKTFDEVGINLQFLQNSQWDYWRLKTWFQNALDLPKKVAKFDDKICKILQWTRDENLTQRVLNLFKVANSRQKWQRFAAKKRGEDSWQNCKIFCKNFGKEITIFGVKFLSMEFYSGRWFFNDYQVIWMDERKNKNSVTWGNKSLNLRQGRRTFDAGVQGKIQPEWGANSKGRGNSGLPLFPGTFDLCIGFFPPTSLSTNTFIFSLTLNWRSLHLNSLGSSDSF